MNYNEKQDIFLFENDANEYRVSTEGKAVRELLTYNDYDQIVRRSDVAPKQLEQAFANYWNARNGDGLHYTDEQELNKAKESDHREAELYREQN